MRGAEYRRALDAAVREYERALADRTALDGRIGQLQETINTLSRLCGLQPTVPWGLTDACRTLLRNAAEPLSAVELRARLDAIGFDLQRYANPLAAIHTTLKRLAGAGEIAPVTGGTPHAAFEFLPRQAPPPGRRARKHRQG
jgi:hypothetical protein